MLAKLFGGPVGKKSLFIYATIFIVGAVVGYYTCVTLSECPFFSCAASKIQTPPPPPPPPNSAAPPALQSPADPREACAKPSEEAPLVQISDTAASTDAAADGDDAADDIKVEEVLPADISAE